MAGVGEYLRASIKINMRKLCSHCRTREKYIDEHKGGAQACMSVQVPLRCLRSKLV